MAYTVKKTDIDSYYTRLNNIRSKFGLSTVSEPEIIQNQTRVLSKDIKSFDQSMTDTANSRSQYITKAGFYSRSICHHLISTLKFSAESI